METLSPGSQFLPVISYFPIPSCPLMPVVGESREDLFLFFLTLGLSNSLKRLSWEKICQMEEEFHHRNTTSAIRHGAVQTQDSYPRRESGHLKTVLCLRPGSKAKQSWHERKEKGKKDPKSGLSFSQNSVLAPLRLMPLPLWENKWFPAPLFLGKIALSKR